ncbi:hypothetical protein AX774_g3186 [Zancudomyces culisetae]|uniref:Uncharacterized protein n=1 Tax=Zancudomyces culisetae TaxID=1213189 RepID=A0A1R1PMM3_ZANCU|nr:hypothetical protein AX774_g4419 [Zancudomyces culisetae]OMH83305.1 hypothetical protein AX774_g3186 [Zancudomyces culisetae]|eukprot:OMH82122.1 hypothetical protein AX774_g4419 [Zancudomyces culisetae]
MAANNSQNLDTAVASDISSYNETAKKLNESLNGHLDTNADVDADTDPNVGVNIDPVEETIVHLNQTQLENRNDNENENENDRGKKLFTVSSSSFSSGSSTPSPNLMPNSNQNSTPVSASGPGSKPNSNPNPNSSPNLDSELKSDVHPNALSREGEDLHDSGSTTSKNRSIHGISELDNKAQQKSNQFDTTNNTLEKKTSLERAKTAEITNSALNLKNTSSGTNLLKTLHKTNKNSSSRASIASITTATIATAIPTTTTTTTAVSVSAPSNSINDPNTIKNSTTNSDNSNNLAGTRKLSNSKTTSYYNTKRLLHSISKISTNSTTNTTATRSPLSGRSSAYSHTSPSIVAEAGAVGDSGRLQRPHLERATSKFGNLIPTQHPQHDSVGKSGNSSNASYKKPKRFLPRASTTTDAKIQQQLQQQQHHHHIQQEQLSPVLRSASLSTSSRWQQDLDYLTSSVQRQYQRERELGMLEAEQEHNLEMAMKYTCIRSLHQVETISSALMLNAPVKNNISSTTMTASSPHSDLRVTHDSDSFDSGSGSGVGGDSNAIQLSTNKIYRDIDDAYTFVAQRSDPLASSKQRSKKLLQVFKDLSNFSTDTTINHSSENSNNNSNLGNSTNANGDITNANNFTEKQNSCILPPSLDYFLGTNSYSGYYPTYGSQSHSYSHGNPYGYGGSSYSLDKTKKIPVWLQPLPREIHDIYYSTDPDSPVRDDRIPHEPPHLKFLNSRAAELKMAMRQNAAASKEKIVAPPRLITSSISALETWKGRRVPGLVNLNCYIGDAGSTLLNRQN